jgi:beta-phosphoglucomutase-like phosphatase (HAD superfamily)
MLCVTSLEPPAEAQALLFDCDGTLVDTMGVYRTGWLQVFGRHGFEMTDEWFVTWGGHSTKAFVEAAFPEGDEDLIEQVSREGHEAFLASVHLLEPFEHVVAVARAHHGRVPLAVVSGGPRAAVLASLRAVGIEELFDIVITVDDVRHGKPAPDVYLKAMAELGVSPERCVAYEDSASGMRSAADAGIPVIHDVRLPAPDTF